MNRPQPLPVEKLEINRSLLKMIKMSNGGGVILSENISPIQIIFVILWAKLDANKCLIRI